MPITYTPRTILDTVPTTVRENDVVDAAFVSAASQLTLAARHPLPPMTESQLLLAFVDQLVDHLRAWQEEIRCLDRAYLVKRTEHLIEEALIYFPTDGEHADGSPVIAELWAAKTALWRWRDAQRLAEDLCPSCGHPLASHVGHPEAAFSQCKTPGCSRTLCVCSAPVPVVDRSGIKQAG